MDQIETKRLIVRELTPEDTSFIFELVNQPSWLQFIGDKGVKTLDDAEKYIRNGPLEMYGRLGFGLFAVDLKEEGNPVGICGLIKRDSLDDIDLGFAFLKRYWGKGYALESAKAVLEFAKTLGISRLVAITTLENDASVRLLEKAGFRFDRTIRLADGDEDLKLFVCGLAGP